MFLSILDVKKENFGNRCDKLSLTTSEKVIQMEKVRRKLTDMNGKTTMRTVWKTKAEIDRKAPQMGYFFDEPLIGSWTQFCKEPLNKREKANIKCIPVYITDVQQVDGCVTVCCRRELTLDKLEDVFLNSPIRNGHITKESLHELWSLEGQTHEYVVISDKHHPTKLKQINMHLDELLKDKLQRAKALSFKLEWGKGVSLKEVFLTEEMLFQPLIFENPPLALFGESEDKELQGKLKIHVFLFGVSS